MAFLLRRPARRSGIPAAAKDQSKWPDAMREEWGNDCGAAAGAAHPRRCSSDCARRAQRLDEFKPDFILMWGDDQYENFREDIIPPFSILAYDADDREALGAGTESAARCKGKPNIWDEAAGFRDQASIAIARRRNTSSSSCSSRSSTSPTPMSRSIHKGLSHAFLNAVLYLDYDRKGFPHRIVPMPINCYGREVIGYRGFADNLGHKPPPDPPSPEPAPLLHARRRGGAHLPRQPVSRRADGVVEPGRIRS